MLAQCLRSVKNIASEVVVVDSHSSDRTVEICKAYKARVFQLDAEFGKKRRFGLKKINNRWTLMLDSDEIVSLRLAQEIGSLLKRKKQYCAAYEIPYQNHFLGRKINYGGENYQMLRLFKTKSVSVKGSLLHERLELIRGRKGHLKGKIYHYSYRSIRQIYAKFTDYARIEARLKYTIGEKSSWKKTVLYPLHMLWARFIKDKGYRDGLSRISLDLGFAYMEWLTYLILAFKNFTKSKKKKLSAKKKRTIEKFKIGFITVFYKNTRVQKQKTINQINQIKTKKDRFYQIDNTVNNRGYASAVNQAIKKAQKNRCNLFVITNPDIKLLSVKRKELTAASKHFDIWGGSMKQNGKRYYGGEIDKWRLSGGLISKKPQERFVPCDFVTGSLMIIKKKVVETIGYFNEEYFMYYEDVDYCKLAANKGFSVGIDRDLQYKHFEASSHNTQKNKWLKENRWKFFWKYSSWKQKIRELVRFPKTCLGR